MCTQETLNPHSPNHHREKQRSPDTNMSRRTFLTSAAAGTGVIAAFGKLGILRRSGMGTAGAIGPENQPVIRVAFVRPDTEQYYMGWPGAQYNIQAHQQQYTLILTEAAEKFGLSLDIAEKPLHSDSMVEAFIRNLQQDPPDGLVLISMSLNDPAWPHINTIAEKKGAIPTVVFSQLGTSFTGHLQGTRNIDRLFVAATQNTAWLEYGLRMLKTIWAMANTRICVVRGNEFRDQALDVIGTTLHYIPRERFKDEFFAMQSTGEMQEMCDYYYSQARKIVEPEEQDMLNAAKNYFVARKIMEDENCHGITMDCLGLIGSRQIPCPPCLAWSRFLDEGTVAACEADWNAAISMQLTHLLFDRPGFMQDPAPNTVSNTLNGAHCVSATRLYGFDRPGEPFVLRSHSESELGVATQVFWREGQEITIMEFDGPERMIIGTGTVLGNNDTPPAGGCRTSVETTVDGAGDTRDVRGFHQLFIYGNLEKELRAYCQLSGIKADPLVSG